MGPKIYLFVSQSHHLMNKATWWSVELRHQDSASWKGIYYWTCCSLQPYF